MITSSTSAPLVTMIQQSLYSPENPQNARLPYLLFLTLTIQPSRFQTFKGEVTVTRTVTNVGPVDSVYRAVVEAPEGVKISVEPETLVFNNSTKKLGFRLLLW